MVTKNLFSGSFMDMLDTKDPLIVLADNFPWSKVESEFQKYYKNDKIGRPNKPIRLMVGLLLLKQIKNLSDERIVEEWKQNPYLQYFCGFTEYTPSLPCHATELVKFRNRIGKDGLEFVFKCSVDIHGDEAKESQVIVDSTVQESNMTFPTDGKLAIKIVAKLLKIAKKEKIKLRRSFIKEIKTLRIDLRFFKHPKKIKKAMGSMKRLRQIAMIILRDIDRKFDDNLELHSKYAQSFYLFNRVLKQERNTPNKIYSLHEIDAYAINKGKDHKGYEFGTKASIVTTMTSSIIVGVAAHKTNIHDSKTLDEVMTNTVKIVGDKIITEAICDRGYRGTKEILVNDNSIEISIPDTKRKKDTKNEINIKRKKFKRRAAIEPIIGHVKSDHRMAINYLKGFKGDEINLLLAATAFNLKKWMNNYLYAFFIRDFTLISISIKEIIRLISLYQLLLIIKFKLELK
jgi:transposase, IS5 family